MISAAAALSGVLGSAFALVIGVPTSGDAVNQALSSRIQTANMGSIRDKVLLIIHKALSLEPGGTDQASWPMTVGIWTYALVASAVAVTYFLNPSETPETIKALAVAFAGYVIALVTAAYGLSR
jgi:hypothetical protein